MVGDSVHPVWGDSVHPVTYVGWMTMSALLPVCGGVAVFTLLPVCGGVTVFTLLAVWGRRPCLHVCPVTCVWWVAFGQDEVLE